MNDRNLKDILIEFKKISPREEFSSRLRTELLSREAQALPVAQLMNVHVMGPSRAYLQFSKPLNALAFAVASVLVIVGVYTITQELSPLFLPGINQREISAEAAEIEKEINIQLSQIDYFQQASHESTKALTQVTQKNLDHLNEVLIQNEAASVQQSSEEAPNPLTQEQINGELQKMLDEVTK